MQAVTIGFRAVADILSQNQTQPMPVKPGMAGMISVQVKYMKLFLTIILPTHRIMTMA